MLINDEEILDFPFNFILLKPYKYDPASGGGGTNLILQENGSFFILLEDGSGYLAEE